MPTAVADRTPTHTQLVRFRATPWHKTERVADIALQLGVVDTTGAAADAEVAVRKLRETVDSALTRIRAREIGKTPEHDRSFFVAGAILMRRAELLSPEEEALLRKDGYMGASLESLSSAGIDVRRNAIALKWKKEIGEGHISPGSFKQNNEEDVFAEVAREVDRVLSRKHATPAAEGDGAPRPEPAPPPEAKPRRPAREVDDPHADYARSLAQRLRLLYSSHSPTSGRGTLPLDQAFVGLPVDLAITPDVEGRRIGRWGLTRVDTSGDEYRTARAEAFDLTVAEELREVASEIVEELDGAIADGIEREYVEGLGRPGVLARPSADGMKWNLRPLLVEEVARAHSRLLLLGAPGSGKSTAARHLALGMATGNSPVSEWGGPDSVPIYASLRDVATAATFKHWPTDGAPAALWSHIGAELGLSESVVSSLRGPVEDGRALVILDGLDEVPTPNRAEDARALEDLLERFVVALSDSVAFLLVTSRPSGAGRWPLEHLVRYELAPLRPRERAELAGRLLRSGKPPDKVAGFMSALRPVPRSLKDRPLFVQLMAAIYDRSTSESSVAGPRLPRRRSRLYRESIELLLERWTRPQETGRTIADRLGCTAAELYRRLAVVAYDTQATMPVPGEIDEISFPLLLTELVKLEGNPDLEAVLSYLSQEAGVLVSPAPARYEFAHKGFQEFLAAAHLASKEDGARLACEHIADDMERWREPCVMLGEALIEETSRSDLWSYVEELLAAARESFGALWLAARLVRDETDAEERARAKNVPLVDDLRSSIEAEFAESRPSNVIDQSDLGATLDVIGDHRPGAGVVDAVPDIDWCRVPDGESFVGSPDAEAKTIFGEDWAAGWSLDRETPASMHAFGDLLVARYPITVSQFRAFLEAEDGYGRDEWWSEAGLVARGAMQPQHPLQTLIAAGNLPCTFVSWWDATAFCRWLSTRLGLRVRLPREAEWERIARGPNGTIFPWANAFDFTACNSQVANLGSVMSVGACPDGAAMWDERGVHDLCGNVWEWTSTAWESAAGVQYVYPYDADDGREDDPVPPSVRRVVRGGSYLNGAFLCRAAYRGRDNPSARFGRQGFRVVAEER